MPAPELALQWRADGAAIPGATGAGFVPTAAEDGRDLDCLVTAANAGGSLALAAGPLRVTQAAPVASGAIADLALTLGGAPGRVAAAGYFSGAGLSFSVAGAGAVIDADGVISVPAGALVSDEPVVVTARNSGGSAESGFRVTVAAEAPVSRVAPALAGSGVIGAGVEVDPGQWGGMPAPELALQWRADGAAIPGATGAAFVPTAAEDGRDLDCLVTAANAGGSLALAAGPLRVTQAAPVASGVIADLALTLGGAPGRVAAAGYFSGDGLSFSVAGAGAVIDADGVISVPAGALALERGGGGHRAQLGRKRDDRLPGDGGRLRHRAVPCEMGQHRLDRDRGRPPAGGAGDVPPAASRWPRSTPGNFDYYFVCRDQLRPHRRRDGHHADHQCDRRYPPQRRAGGRDDHLQLGVDQAEVGWRGRERHGRRLLQEQTLGSVTFASLSMPTATQRTEANGLANTTYTSTGSHFNNAYSGRAISTAAMAAYLGDAASVTKVVSQINAWLANGGATSSQVEGGYYAQHEMNMAFVAFLALRTPAVLSALNSATKEAALALIIEAGMYTGAFLSCNQNTLNPERTLRGRSADIKTVNPNISCANISLMTLGIRHFGLSAALTKFSAFSKNGFRDTLAANGLLEQARLTYNGYTGPPSTRSPSRPPPR